jgi:hypothetical protein
VVLFYTILLFFWRIIAKLFLPATGGRAGGAPILRYKYFHAGQFSIIALNIPPHRTYCGTGHCGLVKLV